VFLKFKKKETVNKPKAMLFTKKGNGMETNKNKTKTKEAF
jgi:hypothetical protein